MSTLIFAQNIILRPWSQLTQQRLCLYARPCTLSSTASFGASVLSIRPTYSKSASTEAAGVCHILVRSSRAVRAGLDNLVATATGVPNLTMQYTVKGFCNNIVVPFELALRNWPGEVPFDNLSDAKVKPALGIALALALTLTLTLTLALALALALDPLVPISLSSYGLCNPDVPLAIHFSITTSSESQSPECAHQSVTQRIEPLLELVAVQAELGESVEDEESLS
ncbi:hypothetical protein C8Q74DRAFT_1369856 [Fomes fomentarius]|nr:hypothetical protein C8Q74DRAFT_1369856 [Fomes fomentarius]